MTLAVLSSCEGKQCNPVPCDRHAACPLQVTAAPEKAGPQAAAVGGSAMLQLLCDCSGAFQPGVLTALVGSSGAGKTTLMDVLAGRKTGAPSSPIETWPLSQAVAGNPERPLQ